jgi:hypothetical protein
MATSFHFVFHCHSLIFLPFVAILSAHLAVSPSVPQISKSVTKTVRNQHFSSFVFITYSSLLFVVATSVIIVTYYPINIIAGDSTDVTDTRGVIVTIVMPSL